MGTLPHQVALATWQSRRTAMPAELRLPVLALPGLSPDSLGNYLASLGLLRVLSRKWPSTRIAWRVRISAHRDHADRFIVITRIGHRDHLDRPS